jgi:hypothetical protein
MFVTTNPSTVKAGKLILAYGRPGIGKSTLAHACPLVKAHLDLETTGFEDREYLRVPRNTFVKMCIDTNASAAILAVADAALAAGAKVLFIDTISALDEIVTGWLCHKNGWADLETPGYGKGHAALRDEMARVVRAIVTASNKGLTIVMLAHTHIEQMVEFDGTVRDVMSPKFGTVKAEKAPYRETLIGNCWLACQVRQSISEGKDGKQTATGLVVDSGVSPGSVTKCRDATMPKVIQITNNPAQFWTVVVPLL